MVKTLPPLVRDFRAARFCSVPLVAIETPDPAATLATLTPVMPDAPIVAWDLVRGLHPVNDMGAAMLAKAGTQVARTINPVSCLEACAQLPQFAVVVFHNLHLHLRDPGVIQALWNLRDLFKQNRRTALLLGITCGLPPELAGDIIVLDEPLPTRAELEPIVDQIHIDADLPRPTGVLRAHILDAIVGLAPFTAEQVLALSLEGPKTPQPGVHLDRLWAHKCKQIEGTPGLKVWRGGERFTDLQGIDRAKAFMQDFVDVDAFGTVVYIDEMDKGLAGGLAEYSGDSGVAKNQVSQLLSYMNDSDSIGVMFAGEAGTGKTALAKATGNAGGKVTIALDFGQMKGGTVGQSERQTDQAFKVITATAEGRVLFIGTANNTTTFTPEINRRFPWQFYFEAPDAAGRGTIWPVYIQRYKLTPDQAQRPADFDIGWTGAEIKRVCQQAALLKKNVVEVARYMVPQSVSAAVTIAKMREQAAGRFLSAVREGVYGAATQAVVAPKPLRRQMQTKES